MAAFIRQKTLSVLNALVIISLAIFCYLPSLSFDFSYDDYLHIPYNKLVTAEPEKGLLLKEIFSSATYPGDLYRPVVAVSYRVTHLLFSLDPYYFHLGNVLLYGLVCLLLYQLFLSLAPKARSLAFAASLVFVVHPLHVEVVANIAGRTELLAAIFFLLSYQLFSKAIASKNVVYTGLSLTCFALSVLSKESAYTLIPILVIHLLLFTNSKDRKYGLLTILSFILLSLSLLYLRAAIIESPFAAESIERAYHSENPLLHETLYRRIIPASQYAGRYLFLHYFPLHLSVDYSLSFSTFWHQVYSLRGFCFALISLTWLFATFYFRKEKVLFFWLLWPIILFSLTLNLFIPIGTIMGERLAFLPSAGVIYATLYLFTTRLKLKGHLPKIALLAFVLLFLILTLYRIPVWRNNKSALQQAVIDNPLSPKAALGLGMYYMHREKDSVLAKQQFKNAHALDPSVTQSARYLIDITLNQKRYGEAEYWCRQVLKYQANDTIVGEKLKVLLKARGL